MHLLPEEQESPAGPARPPSDASSLVMLNRYPYAYAHMMIAPVRHVDRLKSLRKAEMADVLQNLGHAVEILQEAFRPDGFNVGMNLGQVAGAGILHPSTFTWCRGGKGT